MLLLYGHSSLPDGQPTLGVVDHWPDKLCILTYTSIHTYTSLKIITTPFNFIVIAILLITY